METIKSFYENILSNQFTQIVRQYTPLLSLKIAKYASEQNKKVCISVNDLAICRLLEDNVGEYNYRIASHKHKKYDKNTKIIFTTSCYMKDEAKSTFDKSFSMADILILDEQAVSCLDNRIILSIFYKAHSAGIKIPNIVIISRENIKLAFSDKIYQIQNADCKAQEDNKKIIYNDMREKDLCNNVVELTMKLHNNEDVRKKILIIASDNEVVGSVATSLKSSITDVDVYGLPVYGKSYDKSFTKKNFLQEDFNRKIIVTTNIGCTYTQIDNVEIVIDTMKDKIYTVTKNGGSRRNASLVSIETSNFRYSMLDDGGTCYRLVSEEVYKSLREHDEPITDTIPIHKIIINFIKYGLGPAEFLLSNDDTFETIKMLARKGFIKQINKKWIVTSQGNFALKIPLGMTMCSFLWKWIKKGKIYPGVVVASLIDTYNSGYFYFPPKLSSDTNSQYSSKCSAYVDNKFSKWIGYSSLETYFNMWICLSNTVGNGLYRLINGESSFNIKKWALSNSLNRKKINELIRVISETYNETRRYFRNLDSNVYHLQNLELYDAIPILSEIYNHKRVTGSTYDVLCDLKTGEKYQFDKRKIIAHVETSDNVDVIPLVVSEIVSNDFQIKTIELCMHVQKPVASFYSPSYISIPIMEEIFENTN